MKTLKRMVLLVSSIIMLDTMVDIGWTNEDVQLVDGFDFPVKDDKIKLNYYCSSEVENRIKVLDFARGIICT